ncbi:MAG: carboxyvinyl-carboxyphosphonate phosphorylmutase [Burkholderiales bacterium]|jgi:2-methylisocitrate lyase-like PEP mutase family enzyme|nr:carboxyvinyl-carboxyphosphonate phosphorylmutase [Burkholderiales bacterium]
MRQFIGIYDTFSALIVTKKHKDIFLSGLSYTASQYGLPDIGFLTWEDVIIQARRIMSCCPDANLLIDIDDGFGGAQITQYVIKNLEQIGVFGVVIEDQKRPKKCGHLPGKRLIPLEEHTEILEAVIRARKKLFIIARTDASDPEEVMRRITAYNKMDVDAILVDGISLNKYLELKKIINKPLVYNFIPGGKSDNLNYDIDIMLLSLACLSPAGAAINQMIDKVLNNDYSILNETSFKLNKVREYTEKLLK